MPCAAHLLLCPGQIWVAPSLQIAAHFGRMALELSRQVNTMNNAWLARMASYNSPVTFTQIERSRFKRERDQMLYIAGLLVVLLWMTVLVADVIYGRVLDTGGGPDQRSELHPT
ncbi:MAG TPA: hypothetical protein VGM29_20055 [Polyangiaceae bacterium]|jgi:hypothetical protein